MELNIVRGKKHSQKVMGQPWHACVPASLLLYSLVCCTCIRSIFPHFLGFHHGSSNVLVQAEDIHCPLTCNCKFNAFVFPVFRLIPHTISKVKSSQGLLVHVVEMSCATPLPVNFFSPYQRYTSRRQVAKYPFDGWHWKP